MASARFPEQQDSRQLRFAVRMLVPVVQVADSTVWNPGRTRYVLAESVIPDELAKAEEGLPDLLGAHLRAFGPSTAADVSYATGLTGLASSLTSVAEVSGGTARKPEYDVAHREFGVPEDFVLAEYDNVFFAHKEGPLAEARRRLIPNPAGRMHGSVVSRGQVAGSWQHPPDRLPDGPLSAEFERFRDWYRSIDNMLS
ncbi:DNA glycosylase AlkZ-like family protein [Kribbella sp. NPDC059898]|uniref:DNA glycosylase AlkZ-like family protein n=1 Tax=Kribbella sp. NPDC059898 TaxID=3346995 RepID=UPI00366226F2